MKIIHVCIVDAYSEGWAYHRNIISEKNKTDGHEVVILTTRYKMGEHGECVRTNPGVEWTKSGIKVIRLENRQILLPDKIVTRFICPKGIYKTLCEEKPDIIMVHNLQFKNLYEITRYKKEHPEVKLLGDNHADKFNSSGRIKAWSTFRQKMINGPRIRKNFKYFDRFFYISLETKQFFEEMYKIDLSGAKISPLPAPIIEQEEKEEIRKLILKKHYLEEDTLLFVHSGKMVREKKTKWIFEALKQSNIKCKVFLIGSIPEDYKPEIDNYLKEEPRVEYLGWMNSGELRKYLAAADLYLQPGTQSVTMQNALAVGTPIVVYPHISCQMFFNGCEFQVTSVENIADVFNELQKNKVILQDKSQKAYEIAKEYFDINRNATLIYEMER